ncbi:uncharacterized protein LOC122727808 [Dromiciops gliroides]|uniref:uncharacterized protein LOC122727808 n=1 Tax=Dromiciops gliroides TaxID=33562 RepID=UPI001CC3BC01|nr:uncharacterized protein LOC122727808 [Dromiciops gliroides]
MKRMLKRKLLCLTYLQAKLIYLKKRRNFDKAFLSHISLSPQIIADKEPSRLSDVIAITSLIQQLDLDKVVEISIDDLSKDTKQVSSTPAWTDVSPKPEPSPKPLQQNKMSDLLKDKTDSSKLSQMDVSQEPLPQRKKFDMLEDGREGQGKRASAPKTCPAKKITLSPFPKKAVEQFFPMEKKQTSSLMSFGLKLQVKTPPLDRKNCFRTRHFPPLSKFSAEKESELSSKLQSQQERYFTSVTSPFNRKKEIYPGFMRVVNAWTISPVPKMQDHNLPPGKIFMPHKPRRTTVKKPFK